MWQVTLPCVYEENVVKDAIENTDNFAADTTLLLND